MIEVQCIGLEQAVAPVHVDQGALAGGQGDLGLSALIQKDADGNYPIPVPGEYSPYA